LNGNTWPTFLCPNCRAIADLEAEIDDPFQVDEWEGDFADEPETSILDDTKQFVSGEKSTAPITEGDQSSEQDAPLIGIMASTSISETPSQNSEPSELSDDLHKANLPPRQSSFSSLSRRTNGGVGHLDLSSQTAHVADFAVPHTLPIPVQNRATTALSDGPPSTSAERLVVETVVDGPMTPRNNAGPFVFDGSAGRNAAVRSASEAFQTMHPSDEQSQVPQGELSMGDGQVDKKRVQEDKEASSDESEPLQFGGQ
jgi:E3 ubiquitin-protein ligase DMA1/2